MKDKIIKSIISILTAFFSVYFKALVVPLIILIISMVADYLSGITAAWFEGKLNSKTGKSGAIKKVCYMLLVVAAGIIDWVMHYGFISIGIEYEINYCFGLIVCIWLILNELLSILENCTKIGLPIPKFIKPLADRLKIMVDEKGDEGDDR